MLTSYEDVHLSYVKYFILVVISLTCLLTEPLVAAYSFMDIGRGTRKFARIKQEIPRQEMSGAEFKAYFDGELFIMALNAEDRAYGYKFHKGLNHLDGRCLAWAKKRAGVPSKFSPTGINESGGYYFTSLSSLAAEVDGMHHARMLQIPDNARIWPEGDRFKTDQLRVLGRIEFTQAFRLARKAFFNLYDDNDEKYFDERALSIFAANLQSDEAYYSILSSTKLIERIISSAQSVSGSQAEYLAALMIEMEFWQQILDSVKNSLEKIIKERLFKSQFSKEKRMIIDPDDLDDEEYMWGVEKRVEDQIKPLTKNFAKAMKRILLSHSDKFIRMHIRAFLVKKVLNRPGFFPGYPLEAEISTLMSHLTEKVADIIEKRAQHSISYETLSLDLVKGKIPDQLIAYIHHYIKALHLGSFVLRQSPEHKVLHMRLSKQIERSFTEEEIARVLAFSVAENQEYYLSLHHLLIKEFSLGVRESLAQ